MLKNGGISCILIVGFLYLHAFLRLFLRRTRALRIYNLL